MNWNNLFRKKYILFFGILFILAVISGVVLSFASSFKNLFGAKDSLDLLQKNGLPLALNQADSAEIIIVGDIMAHGPQIRAAKQADDSYDFRNSFSLIKPYVESADLAIGNFETTLGGEPYKGFPQFSAPDELVDALKDTGFDVLTTANNHAADRGMKGILRTIEQIQKREIHTTGSFKDSTDRFNRAPLMVSVGSFKIAILAYTYGTNGIRVPAPSAVALIDSAAILKEVTRAEELGAQYILVMIHWGNEYEKNPNPHQTHMAEYLHSIGVDAVIGSHPHVVQKSEIIPADLVCPRPTFVLYSLGNFISNQNDMPSRGGLMLRLFLKRKTPELEIATRASYQYVWVNKKADNGQPRYLLYPINPKGDLPEGLPRADENAAQQFCKRYQDIPLTEESTH